MALGRQQARLRRFGRGQAASTSSIGIAIAAAVFAGSFILAELLAAQPEGIDPRSRIYDTEATNALDLTVGSPGRTPSNSTWERDPDEMTRFGLAMEGVPNFLDYPKVRALRNGTMAASPNGYADYPEVRDNLGIEIGDFHLRSYPVLPGLEDPRWTQDRYGRIAYYARYSGATAPVDVTYGAWKTSSVLNVSVTLQNEAADHGVFQATIGLGNMGSGNALVTETRHTRLLAPGEAQTLWAEFHQLPSWDSGLNGVKIQVSDAYGNPAVDEDGDPWGTLWLSTSPPSGNANSYNLLLTAGQLYFASGSEVTFVGDHYVGAGGHGNSDKNARFVLVGPNGAEWFNQSAVLPKAKNKVYTFECPNCTMVGNYTAYLYDTSMARRAMDVVHVSAATMFTEKRNLDPIAVREIQYVNDLVERFEPTRYDEDTNPDGDIFGDDSNGPHEIAGVLSRYNTLIVGSEVSQTSLNSANTKYAIRDWVQAGGNLVVLGTYRQQSNWLEPIYHAALETANGGIGAPDPTHPVLTTPNRLAYERYLDRARSWDIDSEQPFTHVLTRSAPGGDSYDDTLGLSNPGAFNNGTVVLTSYMAGMLTEPQDDMEAKRFLHNLLAQSHSMLFLDYGPSIPAGVPVGSDSRLVAVPHPNVPGAVVEVRLVMYVFG